MKAIQPYLSFNGNCRQAMEFYARALGGKLDIMPFSDAPGTPIDDTGDRVLHARLTSDVAVLMASDMPPGREATAGDNFSLSVDCESLEEEHRLFAAISEGGHVTMALQDTFWGAHFGMLHDKFGVRWMFNFDRPTQA